jgi:hypothetical protein
MYNINLGWPLVICKNDSVYRYRLQINDYECKDNGHEVSYSPFSLSKQLLPKSITLIWLFVGCWRSIFSGFRSQWIIFFSYSKQRQLNIWVVNLQISGEKTFEGKKGNYRRISPMLNPLKSLLLINSYKLILKSSKTRHRCFRKTKESNTLTLFEASSGSYYID